MDEIDAAVEDAEYVRAMRDGVPQPTKGWDYMSGIELEKYLDKLRKATGDSLSIEGIAGSNLGFYHFTKYLRENGGLAEANFLIAVANFRVRHLVHIS
jgi:Tfp pilus assembly protein PilN